MNKLLIIILLLTTTISMGQVPVDIVGEWTSVYSVNKKYGTKNCLADNSSEFLTMTFKSDGTYIYQYSLNQSEVYTFGKYSFDNTSKTLKLYENKWMPDNFKIQDLKYKVISIDKTVLKLNWCFCIDERDESATDLCLTSYKRTK